MRKAQRIITKRLGAFMMILCIIVGILPVTALASEQRSIKSGYCGPLVRWNYSYGVLTISGEGAMYDFPLRDSVWKKPPWYDNWSGNIKKVVICDGVTNIGERAFQQCWYLQSVTISDSVTDIGDSAFKFCYDLTDITIPDSVVRIGKEAFYNCKKMKHIKIPDSITSISNGAFKMCLELSDIEIPDSVTSICNLAFYQCLSLKHIVLPDNLKSIGYRAFCDCSGLKDITIPGSVTSIDDKAFDMCTRLTNILVDDENRDYASDNGILFTKNKDTLIRYPAGETAESFSIPQTVTKIGNYAFNYSGVRYVEIPDSIMVIGNGVFLYSNFVEAVYAGTEEDWNRIEIYSENEILDGRVQYKEDIQIPVKPENPEKPEKPEAPNVSIDSVTLNRNEGAVDLLKDWESFMKESEDSALISVGVNWDGLTGGRICLAQDEEHYIELPVDGSALKITPGQSFEPGKELYAAVFDADGNVIVWKRVCLNIRDSILKSLILTSENGQTFDLIREQAVYEKDSDDFATVYADADWGYYYHGKVYLMQESNKISLGSGGVITSVIPGKDFEAGLPVYAVVENIYGGVMEKRQIYLSIQGKGGIQSALLDRNGSGFSR